MEWQVSYLEIQLQLTRSRFIKCGEDLAKYSADFPLFGVLSTKLVRSSKYAEIPNKIYWELKISRLAGSIDPIADKPTTYLSTTHRTMIGIG